MEVTKESNSQALDQSANEGKVTIKPFIQPKNTYYLPLATNNETKPSDNVRVELKFNCMKRLEDMYEKKAEDFFPKSLSEIRPFNGQKKAESEEKPQLAISKKKEEKKEESKGLGKLSTQRSKLQITEEKENEDDDDEGTSLIKKYMPSSNLSKPKASEPRALEPPAEEIKEDSNERRQRQQLVIKKMILSYVNSGDKDLSPSKQNLSASTKSSADKNDLVAPLVEKPVNNTTSFTNIGGAVSSVSDKSFSSRIEQRLIEKDAEKTETRVIDFSENSKGDELISSTSKQKIQPKIIVKPGIDVSIKEEKPLQNNSSKPTTSTFKFKFMDTNQKSLDAPKCVKEQQVKKASSKGKLPEESSTKTSLFSFGFSKEKPAPKNETNDSAALEEEVTDLINLLFK